MLGLGAQPLAVRPRRRRSTLDALAPSRETPHSVLNSSSGTNLPKWPSTMASEAAPHSVASSCSTTGVLAGRLIPIPAAASRARGGGR